MMAKLFGLVALFLLSMMSGSLATPCNNDLDCGNEFYCLSEFCEECIPCGVIFNRQPPSNNETLCAKTEQDCGKRNCFPGYEALELTNGQNFSTKCYRSEKVVSSDLPTSGTGSPSAGDIVIASVLVVFMVTLALLAFFSKNIWLKISPPVNAADIEMGDMERPLPSAPLAESVAEETTNIYNDETGKLIHSCPNPVVQVDRLCRAIPFGPHHEYHRRGTLAEDQPLVRENTFKRDNEDYSTVDDATKDAVPSEISSATNTPAMEMPPRLFRQMSAYDAVSRPRLLRSISGSGNPAILLSHHRPTIIQSIDSSDQEGTSQGTDHDQSRNCLELGAALTIKRR